jgi:hypothetical protein
MNDTSKTAAVETIWKALAGVNRYLRYDMLLHLKSATSFGWDDAVPLHEAMLTFDEVKPYLSSETSEAVKSCLDAAVAALNNFISALRPLAATPTGQSPERITLTAAVSQVLNTGTKAFLSKLREVELLISQGARQPRPEKTTILFLAADPTDASRLRLGEEFREIDQQLKAAKQRDRFKLAQPQLSLRAKDISGALLNEQPQIVHFSGHGTPGGALCFENETGQAHQVPPDAISALFEQFANQITCVVLNACYSEAQANAIADNINYVIGMKEAIGDTAAIAFTLGFYQALGAGRTIEEAYKFGCVQIRLQAIPEHLTPTLVKKHNT